MFTQITRRSSTWIALLLAATVVAVMVTAHWPGLVTAAETGPSATAARMAAPPAGPLPEERWPMH